MSNNPKQMKQNTNTIGLIIVFIGLIMGLSFFGWFFTLNDMFAITGIVGIILIIVGFLLIK